MAREARSKTDPIDVDPGSDATLSSDSEGDTSHGPHTQPRAREVKPLARTAAASTGEMPAPAMFSHSMAAARGSLLSAASIGTRTTQMDSVRSITSVAMAAGKKRRLSSPPPFRSSASDDKKPRASLDFRLTPPVKSNPQKTQFIDDDDEDEDDEETKSELGDVQLRSDATGQGALNRVESVRTWVCGQWFGRCVLDIHAVYIQVSLWSTTTPEGNVKREFVGSIQMRQLERFCLSRGKAPYYAVIEFARRVEFEPVFAEFYDGIFARVTEQDGPAVAPDVYGLVLFFDDDLELARCQSLGDVSRTLHSLLESPVPIEINDQVRALKFETPSRSSPERSSTSFFSMVTGKVKGTIDTISHLFTPDRSPQKTMRQSKLQLDGNETSDYDSSAMSTRFRTSSRRKSLLQQSAKDVEVVVQLSGETDRDSGEATNGDNTSDQRSTRGVEQLMRQHHKTETRRLAAERKATLLLSYPFEDSKRPGQITITYGDIDRLKPGEFLNDSIIDFYMRQGLSLYLWRHVEQWQQDHVYFFSSHFFTQLCGGKLSGNVELSEERLRRVARWTQKENLLEKKFLFVPINDSCHWSIAVVCNPGSAVIQKRRRLPKRHTETANNGVILVDSTEEPVIVDTTEDASDSEEEEFLQKQRTENPPCILFLDSLRCHQKKKICGLLKSYLEFQFKTLVESGDSEESNADRTSPEQPTFASFDIEAIKIIEPEIPLQSNSSDCGVFLLMYTAQILQRFPLGLCQEDVISGLSSSMSKQMFDEGHVQEFRDYLHQLIFMLRKIERRDGSEFAIKTEGLEYFAVES